MLGKEKTENVKKHKITMPKYQGCTDSWLRDRFRKEKGLPSNRILSGSFDCLPSRLYVPRFQTSVQSYHWKVNAHSKIFKGKHVTGASRFFHKQSRCLIIKITITLNSWDKLYRWLHPLTPVFHRTQSLNCAHVTLPFKITSKSNLLSATSGFRRSLNGLPQPWRWDG